MTDQKNGISWTDQTWNPIVGCTKVSAGCLNCWAERMARLHYHADFPNGWDGHVKLFPERLEQPLHWRKPRKIAVGLMGDWTLAPIDFIEKLFRVMISASRHTFQLLTKRADKQEHLVVCAMNRIFGSHWRMPDNIWLGVSVEGQATADERITLLLRTPAAVRFVSAEPLLGEISLEDYDKDLGFPYMGRDYLRVSVNPLTEEIEKPRIDWVIVGGESGPGARPMHPDWVRSLQDQCQAASVPFHFKQWGEWAPCMDDIDCDGGCKRISIAGVEVGYNIGLWRATDFCMRRVGKKAAGHFLDGHEWLEFPSCGKWEKRG